MKESSSNDLELVFNQLVGVSNDAQIAFWADNPTLVHLREEVESLLGHDEEIESRGVISLTSSESTDDKPLLFSPGHRLKTFELLFPVSRNPMTEVWCGEESSSNDRVAVKALRCADSSSPEFIRFVAEANCLRSLRHPNIVTFRKASKTENGLAYFVMDWSNGAPITQYCDENRLGIRERVELFRDLCRTMAYVHRCGVVHGDLKPENILTEEQGGLKLIDFGIAQAADKTAAPNMLMTPLYASPEQLDGAAIDATSDVYSLGVLLFELLSGRHPASRSAAATGNELWDVLKSEKRIAPSTVLIRKESDEEFDCFADQKPTALVAALREGKPAALKQQLRGDLDQIVLKALQHDPEKRYPTAEEFTLDIENWLQGRISNARAENNRWFNALAMRPMLILGTVATAMALTALILAAVVGFRAQIAEQNRVESLQQDLVESQKSLARSDNERDELRLMLDSVSLADGSTGSNPEFKKDWPFERRIDTAKLMIDNGEVTAAANLLDLESDPDTGQPLASRLEFAALANRLGRPSIAFAWLPEIAQENPESENQQLCSIAATIHQSLNWHNAAENWRKHADNYPATGVSWAHSILHFGEPEDALSVAEELHAKNRQLSRSDREELWLVQLQATVMTNFESAKPLAEELRMLWKDRPLMLARIDNIFAAQESDPEKKRMTLNQALDELKSSQYPGHILGLELLLKLGSCHLEDNEEKALSKFEQAWCFASDNGHCESELAFELMTEIAKLRSTPEQNTKSIERFELLSAHEHRLDDETYVAVTYYNQQLKTAMDVGNTDLANDASDKLLRTLKKTKMSHRETTGMVATSAKFEATQTTELKKQLVASINKLKSNEPNSPSKILLEIALAKLDSFNSNDKPFSRSGPTFWLRKFASMAYGSNSDQLNSLNYAASDLFFKTSDLKDASEICKHVARFALRDESREPGSALNALEFLARHGKADGFTKELSELQKSSDDEVQQKASSIELLRLYHRGDENLALEFAKKLIAEDDESDTYRTAIWQIQQFIEANKSADSLQAWIDL